MPRRPDLIKASLWAGLVCLSVCLTTPGWGREAGETFVLRREAADPVQTSPPSRLHLAQRSGSSSSSYPSLRSADSSSGSGRTLHLLFRFLAGGVLGPILWHYTCGYPLRSSWQQGLGPPGLLDLLVAVALGFLGYRLYRSRWEKDAEKPQVTPRGFLRPEHRAPPALTVQSEAESGLAAISAADPEFSLQAFGEETRRLLLELYTAWNLQELEVLAGRVKEGLLDYLRMGLKIMSLREELSHLEELSLEDITITAAGVNDGREFITLNFRGWLLDYVLDRKSGKLLVGSMAYPNLFHEVWELERPRGQGTWMLQDIREK